MPFIIQKYLFIALFGLFLATGFLIGNDISTLVTHTMRKDVSPGVAIAIAIGLLVVTVAAVPLIRIVKPLLTSRRVGGDSSLAFLQVVIAIFWIFSCLLGVLMPNGPFNAN